MGSQKVGHNWATFTYTMELYRNRLATVQATTRCPCLHDTRSWSLSSGIRQTWIWTSALPGSIPGSGRSPGEGNGNPLQYSCLGNPMDRGAWWATVHRVAKSQTQLSDFTFTFTFFLPTYYLWNFKLSFLACVCHRLCIFVPVLLGYNSHVTMYAFNVYLGFLKFHISLGFCLCLIRILTTHFAGVLWEINEKIYIHIKHSPESGTKQVLGIKL